MVNDVGFVISEEEDLTSGPGTRFDDLGRILLKWKRTEKASDKDIRKGTKDAPLARLSKALYTFARPTPTTHILN